MFGNTVLKVAFGPSRNEVEKGRGKLYRPNEELNNLYPFPVLPVVYYYSDGMEDKMGRACRKQVTNDKFIPWSSHSENVCNYCLLHRLSGFFAY